MQELAIDVDTVDPDPFKQFKLWLADHLKTPSHEPYSAFLATANKSGEPTGRVVLIKSFDQRGFYFFTNYESRKAKDLIENPKAALTFYWGAQARQVRVEGAVEKTSAKVSDDYFESRPWDSCIGAWASQQGKTLKSRSELESKVEELKKKYANKKVPRPQHWGGFVLKPMRIEFWQGRSNRLHDRVEFSKEGDKWTIQRLSP